MPHRTTYLFPREVPDQNNRSPSRLVERHENKFRLDDVNSGGRNKGEIAIHLGKSDRSSRYSGGGVSQGVTSGSSHRRQLDTLVNWFSGRQKEISLSHVNPVKITLCENDIDEEEEVKRRLLSLPHEQTEGDRYWQDSLLQRSINDSNFEGQACFRRLSGEGSTGCAESLLTGTTLDGNWSSFTTRTLETSGDVIKEVEGEEKRRQFTDDGATQRYKEGYDLKLLLAKRLTEQATLVTEPLLLPDRKIREDLMTGGSSNTEIVSYRLWVSGCLSYADKISDGFYNILGMNPHLWMMSNSLEEGRRMPSLMALRAIAPNDSSLEVTLVDRFADVKLREIVDKAKEIHLSSENQLVLAEKLGKLVALSMGGSSAGEQGELVRRWKLVNQRLRESYKCIVVPIGSLSSALCRHRTILFKLLADHIGLPCRIAQGCKYCWSDHQSSCLIKIEDEKKFVRECVVDLVGQPGNVHCPDSSINGSSTSFVPSPLQVSHLRQFQQDLFSKTDCQELNSSYASKVRLPCIQFQEMQIWLWPTEN